MSDWTGVIVRDGLLDVSVLDHLSILEERTKELGISGFWTVLEVGVSDEYFDKVVKLLSKGLRQGWYAYFSSGKKMTIIFKGKVFNITKGSKRSLLEVKNYAFKEHNIMPGLFSLNI